MVKIDTLSDHKMIRNWWSEEATTTQQCVYVCVLIV